MDYTAVSQAARRFKAKILKDKSLKKKVEPILEKRNIEMSNVKPFSDSFRDSDL